MCEDNMKQLDEKINTQSCNYNYKNDIGLAMLGQVHTRLQLDTCRVHKKKWTGEQPAQILKIWMYKVSWNPRTYTEVVDFVAFLL
jgi:hypothetical protein